MRWILKHDLEVTGEANIPAGTIGLERCNSIGESHDGFFIFGEYPNPTYGVSEEHMKQNPDWFERSPTREIGDMPEDYVSAIDPYYNEKHPLTPAEVYLKVTPRNSTEKLTITQDNWWDTCTSIFLVLYTHSSPHQVRVWAKHGLPDETPQNTFKGQFIIGDARIMHTLMRLAPQHIEQSYWSPMADGMWDYKDTQPLVTSL